MSWIHNIFLNPKFINIRRVYFLKTESRYSDSRGYRFLSESNARVPMTPRRLRRVVMQTRLISAYVWQVYSCVHLISAISRGKLHHIVLFRRVRQSLINVREMCLFISRVCFTYSVYYADEIIMLLFACINLSAVTLSIT